MIIFCRGVYLTENTTQAASVRLVRCKRTRRARGRLQSFCQKRAKPFFDSLSASRFRLAVLLLLMLQHRFYHCKCARAALMDGEAVADRLTNTCEAEQREQREAMERSLTRDEERIEVLDKMVMRLYEDMIAGRISEQNFNTMLEKTQTEQAELKAKVSEGRKRLSDEVQLANDAKQWVEAIQEYANITELDAATLNRSIKEIVVHERIDEDKTRHISIEIHFRVYLKTGNMTNSEGFFA